MAIAGQRIGADEVRAESGDDGRVERRRTEAFAPADGAVLADDLDQAGGAHIRAVERPGERLAEPCLQHVRPDVGDAHAAPWVRSTFSVRRIACRAGAVCAARRHHRDGAKSEPPGADQQDQREGQQGHRSSSA